MFELHCYKVLSIKCHPYIFSYKFITLPHYWFFSSFSSSFYQPRIRFQLFLLLVLFHLCPYLYKHARFSIHLIDSHSFLSPSIVNSYTTIDSHFSFILQKKRTYIHFCTLIHIEQNERVGTRRSTYTTFKYSTRSSELLETMIFSCIFPLTHLCSFLRLFSFESLSDWVLSNLLASTTNKGYDQMKKKDKKISFATYLEQFFREPYNWIDSILSFF